MNIPEVSWVIQSFIERHRDGVVVIRWATATGKTALAVNLSDFFDVEIISADSRQVFQGMNIGTDKISDTIRDRIPHHLIDIVTPYEIYSSSQWQQDCYRLIEDIHGRWNIPLVVGGTWLYIETIYRNFSIPEVHPDYEYRSKLEQLEHRSPWTLHAMLVTIDPLEATRLHPNASRHIIRALEIYHKTGLPKSTLVTSKPVRYPLLMIGIERSIEETNQRIDIRVNDMIELGLIEEVQKLVSEWCTVNSPWMKCIGYSETLTYIDHQITKEELIKLICIHSHQYAKRQRTRFRRYIRDAQQKAITNIEYLMIDL